VIGFSLTSRKEYAAALLARRVAELAPDKVLLAGGPATADRESRDRLFKLFAGR
jgi:predicted NBD/HSP70 family sugar kinase